MARPPRPPPHASRRAPHHAPPRPLPAAPGARGHLRLHLYLHLLVVVMLVVLPARVGAPCTSAPCFCFSTPDWDQCRYLALQEPPEGLPEPVRNLSILGGNLTVLPGAAFAGGWRFFAGGGEEEEDGDGTPCRPLPHLRALLLTHSGVEEVAGGAFAGLPSLALLDLSHNPLRALSPRAFAFLPRLRGLRLNGALLRSPGGAPEALLEGSLTNLSLSRLELRGNLLREPPPAWALPPSLREMDLRNNSLRALRRLDALRALAGLRLQLAPNPLDCQCASLRPLLLWPRNASWRLPDAPALRCASPPQLRRALLRRLRPSQLGCPPHGSGGDEEEEGWGLLEAGDPQLETASYVFFGIVLALIGLVFLMVLYLNRRGIKRWLNNLREACRDQMEGYHYRYEQDSDPRRGGSGDL